MLSVCRARTYPAGTAVVGARVLDSSGGTNSSVLQSSAGTTLQGITNTQTAAATFSGTGVHVFELYMDSAGVAYLDIDGTNAATNGTGGSLTNNSNHLSFGGSHTGTIPSDSSHALHLFCQTKPTDAIRYKLISVCRDIWGF